MRIFITGMSGKVGGKLAYLLIRRKHKVLGTYTSNKIENGLKIRYPEDSEKLQLAIGDFHPDVIVHCAAIPDVDYCENNPKESFLINSEYAKFISQFKCKKVHISTDYVFDGTKSPYDESRTDFNPLNTYAKHKVMAEKYFDINKDLIVRTTTLFGFNEFRGNPDFIQKCIQANAEEKELRVDAYEIRYPTWIDDVTEFLCSALENDFKGIAHISGDEAITKYDFALLIKKVFKLQNLQLQKVKNEIERPKNCRLINTRFYFRPHSLEFGLKNIKRIKKW